MFLQGLAEEKFLDQGNLDRLLSGIFSRSKKALTEDEKLSSVAMIDYGKQDMTGRSYSIGALLFGLLHHQAGEQALLGFVRDYSRTHRESGSTDREFAAEIVKALGEPSRVIVEEWFLTPGFAERLAAAENWAELKQAY